MAKQPVPRKPAYSETNEEPGTCPEDGRHARFDCCSLTDANRDLALLRQYLRSMPSGAEPDTREVERLLASAWEALQIEGDDTKMAGDKLLGRMIHVRWDPPILSFTIERHGGTVLGSTRAEVHAWTIDIAQATTVVSQESYRQVVPRQAPLDVTAMASEVAHLILTGQPDKRLQWREDGSVHVLIETILPQGSAARETLAGRRKRFARALSERLAAHGWGRVVGAAAHTYRRAH